jgi:hypothetical protein
LYLIAQLLVSGYSPQLYGYNLQSHGHSRGQGKHSKRRFFSGF